jgi:hypothetical protein
MSYTQEQIEMIIKENEKLKEENFNQYSRHLHSLESVRKKDLRALNEILKEKDDEIKKLKEKAEEDRLKKVKLKNDLQIANMLLIDDVISEKIDDSIQKGINQITINSGKGFYKEHKINYIKEYIIPHLLKNNSNSSDEEEQYSTFKNGYYYYKGFFEEQYEVEKLIHLYFLFILKLSNLFFKYLCSFTCLI